MKNPSVLKIGQASKALGVSIDTLRRWEASGKINAERTAGGTRVYSPFVKIGEAAKVLGVSIDTLRRWERAGKITPVRTPGSTRLYSLDELRKITPTSETSSTADILIRRSTDTPINDYDHFSHPVALETLIKQKVEERFENLVEPISKPKKIYAKIYAGATLCLILLLFLVTLRIGLLSHSGGRSPIESKDAITSFQHDNNVLAASSIAEIGKFLEINADTIITGNLAVDGESIFGEGIIGKSTLSIAGVTTLSTTSINSTLSVTGLTTATGGLTTPGKITLTGNEKEILLIKPSSDPSSATKLFVIQNAAGTEKASIDSSGNASFAGTLKVSGATTLSSTISVSGATTLSSSLEVSGTTTLSGALSVSGASTLAGATVISSAGAASTPGLKLTGAWYTGGSTTTTKPQLLVEPTDTTSTGWSASGTGIGVNAKSSFTGNLIDLQVGGSSKYSVDYQGNVLAASITSSSLTALRAVFTDSSSNLTTTGASAALLNALSDETGSGLAVFGTSPTITTSLITDSTTFALVNTTATTINFGGAATTLSIGASTGTTTINNNTTLGDATTDTITFTARLASSTSLIPVTDGGSDLGTSALRFNNLYVNTINASSSQSTSGQATFTYDPTSDIFSQASVYINPTTADSNDTGLTIALAGTLKAQIDYEGDAIFGYSSTTDPDLSVPLAIYNHGTTQVFTIEDTGVTTLTGTSSLDTETALNITGASLTTGELVDITGTYAPTAGGTQSAIDVNLTNSPSTNANTLRGLDITTTDATALGNTVTNFYSSLTSSGNAAKTLTGYYSTLTSSSTTADTLVGVDIVSTHTGAISTGTKSIYGIRSIPNSSGATDTGGTINTYGGYFDATGAAGGTSSVFGVYIADVSGGDTNVALCFDCDGTYSASTVASGIQFGTDTNAVTLYRSASDILRTGDGLTVDLDLIVSGGDITGTGDESIDIGEATANAITLLIDATGEVLLTSAALSPSTSDGNALGTTALMWSDLFLASGGVINFNNGDVTLTHGSDTLTFDGGSTIFNEAGGDFDLRIEGDTATTLFVADAGLDAIQITPSGTRASAAGATWDGFSIPASTATITGSTAITTATGFNLINIAQPTLSAASALTVTNSATLYIANAPTGGGVGPAAITNPYALWVDAGNVRLDGTVIYQGTSTYIHNTGGVENFFAGVGAGNTTLTGLYNTAVGGNAGNSLTSASSNTFTGRYAGFGATTGGSNTATGYNALNGNGSNITGTSNTAYGSSTLFSNTTGTYNAASGSDALNLTTTGSYNTAMGGQALYLNVSGANNTATGYYALRANTGDNNIALGYQAGDNITSGSTNIVIGYSIDAPSATASNQMTIGNLIFATGVDGTGTTLSTGSVGIRVAAPAATLDILAPAATTGFNLAGTAPASVAGNGTSAATNTLLVVGTAGGASSGTTGQTGGTGGALSLTSGIGGAVAGASGIGGIGGGLTLASGAGGNGAATGGAGGTISITAGNAGTGGNAAGGGITLTAGTGTGSGAPGAIALVSSVATGTTTTSALTLTGNSLTTGTLGYLTSSSITTGKLLDITTGTANTWTGNGTTNGLVNLASSSTAGTASSSDILLNIARSGANAQLAHTAYGIYSAVTNTNVTSGTNVAGYFSASGATTNNYALYANAGSDYFATTQTVASGASATLDAFNIPASTITVSGSTNITTATGFNLVNIGQPTYSNASVVTTNAATLYIANAPTASGGGSITNPYALWVDAGASRFDGQILASGGSQAAPGYSFNGDTDTGMFSDAAGQVRIGTDNAYRIYIGGPTAAQQMIFVNPSTTSVASVSPFTFNPGIYTNITGESKSIFNGTTLTITGDYSHQRSWQFQPSSIDAVTTTRTITNAANVWITGAPSSSGTAVLTNSYAAYIQAGGNGTNLYGIYLESVTGGTNNYAIYSAGGSVYHAPTQTVASAASATLDAFNIPASTITVSGSTNITTATGFNLVNIGQPTYSNASVVTTNAATLYIANAPTASGGGSITNPYALWVDAGAARFDGAVAYGAQATFTDSDATPDVSAGSHFITNTTAVSITDFDAGSGTLATGQVIYVESNGVITYDVTVSGLNGGTTDLVSGAGDMTTWIYDGTDWNLISWMDDSVAQAGGADLAEWYVSAESLEPGDVVSVARLAEDGESRRDKDLDVAVRKSEGSYEPQVMGIVSTEPAIILGTQDINTYAIALAGRVPVKVSTENGPIEKGDYLTSSSTPGVAMKATKPGPTIGKALEAFSGEGIGKILIFVNVSWADPSQALANLLLDEEGNLVIPKVKTASLEIGPIGPISQIGQEQENALDVASKLKVIDEAIATQSAVLASLKDSIASATALLQNDVDNLKLTPPEILLATGSATLANIKATDTLSSEKLLTALDVNISGVFKALGESFMGNTTIAGNLVVDGTFSISGNSINAIGLSPSGILYLQNNPLSQGLDILNGKFIFDKEGKLTVAGTVEAEQFSVTSGKSAGTGKILAGQTESIIENSFVKPNSIIIVTPEVEISQTISVVQKTDGTSFKVKITNPETKDIIFSYLIIGQGQKTAID